MVLPVLIYVEDKKKEKDLAELIVYFIDKYFPHAEKLEFYLVNEKQRRGLQRVINSYGKEVIVDENFRRGVKKFARRKPIILILDRSITRSSWEFTFLQKNNYVDSPANTYFGLTHVLIDSYGNITKPPWYITISWKNIKEISKSNPYLGLQHVVLHEMGHLFGMVPLNAKNASKKSIGDCKYKKCIMHAHQQLKPDEKMEYILKVNPQLWCKSDYKTLEERVSWF